MAENLEAIRGDEAQHGPLRRQEPAGLAGDKVARDEDALELWELGCELQERKEDRGRVNGPQVEGLEATEEGMANQAVDDVTFRNEETEMTQGWQGSETVEQRWERTFGR